KTIELGYGEEDMTWDAGVIKTVGSVGDYVWLDENQDGIQDDWEQGIGGVTVMLEYNESGEVTDESMWTLVGTTQTNEAGYYRFNDLGAGYYRVRFQIPEGYTVTQANAGS